MNEIDECARVSSPPFEPSHGEDGGVMFLGERGEETARVLICPYPLKEAVDQCIRCRSMDSLIEGQWKVIAENGSHRYLCCARMYSIEKVSLSSL